MTAIEEEAINQLMQEKFHKLHFKIHGPNDWYNLRSQDIDNTKIGIVKYRNKTDWLCQYKNAIEIWW